MAAPLVLIEGFESRSIEAFDIGTGGFSAQTGRYGGYCASINNGSPTFRLKGSGDEISIGCSLYNSMATGYSDAIHVKDSAGNALCYFGTGSVVGYCVGGSITNASMSGGAHPTATWRTVEVKFKYGASGWFELRANGVVQVSYTGNTLKTGASGISDLVMQSISGSYGFWIDDLWVERGAGAGYRGDRRVYSIAPTADSSVGWAASTGANHWSVVSESPAATASYVSTPALTGVVDNFVTADITTGIAVDAIAVSTIAQRSDAGSANLAVVKNGVAGTIYAVTDSGSAWQRVSEVFETDDVGAAWTAAKVNSSTYGIKASA